MANNNGADIFGIGSIAGSLIDMATAFGVSAYNNREAAIRENIARYENYKYGERSADAADKRTRALYEDLYSPQAQLAQLKAAGLSPSLFYGDGGGISGQTGAMGTGATGINPNVFGASPASMSQVAKTIAETNLIKAQTEKTEEETKTEAGVNDLGKARVDNIVADTNNKTLKAVYQEYENSLAEIEVSTEASLLETKIQNYIKQTEYLGHITRSAAAKGDIDEQSKDDVIKYLNERTKNIVADTLLKQSQETLTNENVNLTKQQVLDLIDQITQRGAQTEINRDTLNAQIDQWAKQNNFKEQEIKILKYSLGEKGLNDLIKLLPIIIKLAK